MQHSILYGQTCKKTHYINKYYLFFNIDKTNKFVVFQIIYQLST